MSFKASKALMELRVHLCQSSAASKGIRCAPVPNFPNALQCARPLNDPAATCPGSEFWAANYAKIKEANLTLPILLRESANTPAKLTTTYGAPGLNAALRRSPPDWYAPCAPQSSASRSPWTSTA